MSTVSSGMVKWFGAAGCAIVLFLSDVHIPCVRVCVSMCVCSVSCVCVYVNVFRMGRLHCRC